MENDNIVEYQTKKRLRTKIFEGVTIIAAALVSAVGMHCFVYSNGFAPTGVDGIAAMVQELVKFNAAYTSMILNLPLLIFAYFKLSREYVFKVAVFTVLHSVFILLLDVMNVPAYYAEDKIIAALFAGVIIGTRTAMMLKIGSSTGGIDIISAFINKRYPWVRVEWGIFGLSVATIGASYFVYQNGFTPIFLTLIFAFVSSFVTEKILNGAKSAIEFKVVTDDPDGFVNDILKFHGATIIPAKGAYTNREKAVIMCVVNRRQVPEFERIIKAHPGTFAYFNSVNNIIGNFIRDKNEPLH